MADEVTPEGEETPIAELTEILDIETAANTRLDEFNQLKALDKRGAVENARIVELQEEMTVLATNLTAARESEAAANSAEAPSFDAPVAADDGPMAPPAGTEPAATPPAETPAPEAPAETPAAEEPPAETPATPDTPEATPPSVDSEAELQAAQAAVGGTPGTPPSETPAVPAVAMDRTVEWHAAGVGYDSDGDIPKQTVVQMAKRFSKFLLNDNIDLPEGSVNIAQAIREPHGRILGTEGLTGDLEMAAAVGWHEPTGTDGDGLSLDLAGCCVEDSPVIWEQSEDLPCDERRPIYDWLMKASAAEGCIFRVKLRRDRVTGLYFQWNYDCDDAQVGMVAPDGTVTMYDATDEATWKNVNLVANRDCDVYLVYGLQGHGFNIEQSRARMICDPKAWDEMYGWLEQGYWKMRESAYMESFSNASRLSGAHFHVVGNGVSAHADIRAMLAEIIPGIESEYCMNFNDASVFTERGIEEWLGVEDERDPAKAALSDLNQMFARHGINGGFIRTNTVIPGTTPNFPDHTNQALFSTVGATTGNIKAADALVTPHPGPIPITIQNTRKLTFLIPKRGNFRLLQGAGQRLTVRGEVKQLRGNMDRFAQYEDDETLIPKTDKVDCIRIDAVITNNGGRSGYTNVVPGLPDAGDGLVIGDIPFVPIP